MRYLALPPGRQPNTVETGHQIRSSPRHYPRAPTMSIRRNLVLSAPGSRALSRVDTAARRFALLHVRDAVCIRGIDRQLRSLTRGLIEDHSSYQRKECSMKVDHWRRLFHRLDAMSWQPGRQTFPDPAICLFP